MDDELKVQLVDLAFVVASALITVAIGLLGQLARKASAWFDQQIQATEQGKLETLATGVLEDLRRQSASDAPLRYSTKTLAVQQLATQLAAKKPKQKAAIELAVEQAARRQGKQQNAAKQVRAAQEPGLSAEQIAALVKLLMANGVAIATGDVDTAANERASASEVGDVHGE